MHWCMATVCQSAMFPSWVWGRGPKKRLRGPDSEVVLSPLHDKTVENHFYKGGFFCALAHGHSMPVCNFFLMDLGEGPKKRTKKLQRTARSSMVKLYFRHCTKKNGRRSLLTTKCGCVFYRFHLCRRKIQVGSMLKSTKFPFEWWYFRRYN